MRTIDMDFNVPITLSIEVEDNATDEEIQALLKDDFAANTLELTFEDVSDYVLTDNGKVVEDRGHGGWYNEVNQ